ncbi:hypothetical protein DAI22_12g124700 [Oryza sativa Japonica Group]|nr:hypothetical protein DAI22_12g124700 [Oryza sativa Japonica Group]
MEGAHKLNAKLGDNGDTQFSLDEKQEVVDSFRGTRMWWKLSKASDDYSLYGRKIQRRNYMLVFHKRHRQLVQDSYLPEILQQGRALTAKNRQRRLYTHHENHMSTWTHVPWKHPATFDTLAMDPGKKDELIEDLKMFQKGKEYHSKVGKAWKRGYLLYGPSGTGKSSTISAMANFLKYDVYDLDLTTVTNNTDLRNLFLQTTEQSIIVIEDIHAMELEDKRMSTDFQWYYERKKITLSGLLNFIDGLWSACGGERIIVLTTNHVDKLDPGLIRRGRMDKHIEMSYCRFEAFKVLANNYLDITEHPLFTKIQRLLDETDMTPADVAHNLMPQGKRKRNTNKCLTGLIQKLKKAKLESGTRLSRGRVLPTGHQGLHPF